MATRRVRAERVPRHIQLFQGAFEELLLTHRLTRTELLLLCLCITRCDYGGWLYCTHRELGEIGGIGEAEVSRAMGRLARAGYILREPTEKGRGWQYRLPATVIHRGPLDQIYWEQARDSQRQDAQRVSPTGSSILRNTRPSR